MPPKLFVSHCSREGDLARLIIDALCTGIGDSVAVLMDQKVFQPGDRWRPELWDWWAECDAAVIVCSPEALQSDWVLIETAVLKHRQESTPNGDFKVFPILVVPVTAADLRGSRLNAQLIAELVATPPLDESCYQAVVGKLADELRVLAELDPEGRPLYRWERHIGGVIENEVSDPKWLIGVRKAFGAGSGHHWPVSIGLQSRLLARELLDCPDKETRMKVVKDLAVRVKPSGRTSIMKLVVADRLGAEEVRPVREVLSRKPGDRAVEIDTREPFIGECWVTRASATFPPWPSMRCKRVVGADPERETLDSIRDDLKKRFNTDHLDEVDHQLDLRQSRGEPFFVILSARGGIESYLEAILTTLYGELSPLSFALLTADGPRDRDSDMIDEYNRGIE